MARVEGFEPPTAWFVARYSIQLSYTRAKLVVGRHCQRIMAEREGFEPSKPFDLHTFQACSFDHSDTPPDQCSHWSPDCVVFPLRTRRILSITFEWRKPFFQKLSDR